MGPKLAQGSPRLRPGAPIRFARLQAEARGWRDGNDTTEQEPLQTAALLLAILGGEPIKESTQPKWSPIEVVDEATGEKAPEAPSLPAPLGALATPLGPLFEANLLLPRRFDPFGGEVDVPWIQSLLPHADLKPHKEDFKPAEQRQRLGYSLAARADTPLEQARWRWQIHAGGSFRQGNAATTNVNVHAQLERHSQVADFFAKIGAVVNQDSTGELNRRASGEFLVDRNLRGRWLLYAREDLTHDEARLIDVRSVTSVGLGFKFIDELNQRWVARTGPSLSYWDYAVEAKTPDRLREGWLLESDYRRVLWQTTRIEWTARVAPDFETVRELRVTNQAALVFPIGGHKSQWAWKIGMNHEYQVDPVQRTKSNDVEGYFAITYSN